MGKHKKKHIALRIEKFNLVKQNVMELVQYVEVICLKINSVSKRDSVTLKKVKNNFVDGRNR